MDRETEQLHARLKKLPLPPGWICEKGWPWREATHLVAPGRKGGVIVKHRHVRVQLQSDDKVCSPTVDIHDDGEHKFAGRGWRDRIVSAAKKAVSVYQIIGDTDGEGPKYRPPINWQDL